MRTTVVALLLIPTLVLPSCHVQRSVVLDRNTVRALPAKGVMTVIGDDGDTQEAQVRSVSLHMRGPLKGVPKTFKFHGFFKSDVPFSEVREQWLENPLWDSASAEISVWEPGQGASVTGGVLLGIPVGAVVGVLASSCGGDNCEDGIGLVFAGALLGTAIGGLLGGALGYGLYRASSPTYSSGPAPASP